MIQILNTKTYLLWNQENAIVLPEDIIEMATNLSGVIYKTNIVDFTNKDIEMLNSYYETIFAETYKKEKNIKSIIKKPLKYAGYNCSFKELHGPIKSEHIIVFDISFDDSHGCFSDLRTWDIENSAYIQYDGNKTKQIYSYYETEVEVIDHAYCLDTWNGSSICSVFDGIHEHLYKILFIDENSVNDMYLLVVTSEHIGIKFTGDILTKDGIIDLLEKTHRQGKIKNVFGQVSSC